VRVRVCHNVLLNSKSNINLVRGSVSVCVLVRVCVYMYV